MKLVALKRVKVVIRKGNMLWYLWHADTFPNL